MGKRLDSKYLPGKRSRDWLKFKTHGEQEFVVVGYTKGKGRREWSFGSLVLATNGAEGLEWVGNVGTGFDDAEQERLLKKLRAARARRRRLPAAAEDAAGPQGRRRLGRAEARRRGLVRRVHARRPPARAGLPRSARRQGRERGAARDCAADSGGDQQGQACPAALEPRQAVLARGGDHEGRPARLLPRRCAGRWSRTCATGRSR